MNCLRIALVSVLSIVFLSCGDGSTPAAATLTPADLYQQSNEKMRLQQTLHLQSTIWAGVSDPKGRPDFFLRSTGDLELPDKFRGTLREGYGGGLSQEFMVIGTRMWTRSASPSAGEWRESRDGAKNVLQLSSLILIDPTFVKSVEELDPETIDGRRTRHLVMDLDFSSIATSHDLFVVGITPLLSETSSLKLQAWVDPASLLIARQVFGITRIPNASAPALAIQMDYTRYGSPIDPPITVPQ